MLACSLLVALFLLTLAWASEIVGVFVGDETLVCTHQIWSELPSDVGVGEEGHCGFSDILYLCRGLCNQCWLVPRPIARPG